jgi:[protein-PII] uridylyltransferase
MEDPFVLYLALLLHDTGKASAARHHAEASAVNAQSFSPRLQLSVSSRSKLILLVDHHLTLSEFAQRRNIEDSETVAAFAQAVRSKDNLNALMLLTLADGQGTSGQNWSDWKETLVWQLYETTGSYLSDADEFFKQRIERADLAQAITKRMARYFLDEIATHLESMPDRYFQSHNVNEIVAHIRLFRTWLETRYRDSEQALAPALRWHHKPDQGHSEVWICTWDRAALMAKIAGSFAAASLNILSADAYTRTDNLMLEFPGLRFQFPTRNGRKGCFAGRTSTSGSSETGAIRFWSIAGAREIPFELSNNLVHGVPNQTGHLERNPSGLYHDRSAVCRPVRIAL